MAVPFRLKIPSPCLGILYFESVQEVADSVSWCLEFVADELSILRSPPARSTSGGDELFGRVVFKDVRSFSDSHGQIVRETYLYLGGCALGSSLAMLVVDFLRKEIFECLKGGLPFGSVRAEGAILIVEMKDGVLRLKPALDRYRSSIHIQTNYTPAFHAGI